MASQRTRIRGWQRKLYPGVAIVILSFLGAGVIYNAMKWGPWAYSDGAGYIMLARNLLAGVGLGLVRASGEFQPLSTHPPLYPILLATVSLTGMDPLEAARWLDSALFALVILLTGTVVYVFTRQPWLSLCASIATLVSPTLVELYAGVLSEPLFFVTFLASVALLGKYWATRQPGVLVAAAIIGGLAALSRYPGLALLAGATVSLMVFGKSANNKRWRDGAAFIVWALAPSAVWLAWIQTQPGSDQPRQWLWDFHDLWNRTRPIRGGMVEQLWEWIPLPGISVDPAYRIKLAVLALGGLLMSFAVARAIGLSLRVRQVNWREHPVLQLVGLLVAFVVCYLAIFTAVFLFSREPLDAADVDRRMLAPIHLSLVIGLFALAVVVLEAWPRNGWVKSLPGILTLLAVASYLPRSLDFIGALERSGAGYTSEKWRSSETIAAARGLAGDIVLISNESTVLAFYLNRPAYDLPQLVVDASTTSFARFGDGPTEADRIFRERGAALVLFDTSYWQYVEEYGDLANAGLQALTAGLLLHQELGDGAIYFYPVSGEASPPAQSSTGLGKAPAAIGGYG